MGQYLAMGLMHKMIISQDELKKGKISRKELRQEIKNTMSFDLKLYDELEDDQYLLFTLKNKVLETDLIPFLEVLYPKIFDKHYESDYLDLLKQLRSTPSSEWLDLANKSRYYSFRMEVWRVALPSFFRKKLSPNYLHTFQFADAVPWTRKNYY